VEVSIQHYKARSSPNVVNSTFCSQKAPKTAHPSFRLFISYSFHLISLPHRTVYQTPSHPLHPRPLTPLIPSPTLHELIPTPPTPTPPPPPLQPLHSPVMKRHIQRTRPKQREKKPRIDIRYKPPEHVLRSMRNVSDKASLVTYTRDIRVYTVYVLLALTSA